MKKLSSKNHSIHNFLITILLLGGGLFAAAGLASCENFLDGGDVKREIEDAIAYNNAKQLTVLLSAQEGTGSTLPSGNYTAKQGYDFEISFSENPAYSFVKWTAVSRTDSKTEITEGITFEDKYSSVTKVKITNLSDSIKIVPLCEKRIEVYGEPNPRYEPIGVSRDRSITVNFTKELAVENFFFDETEIPADAEEIKKDEEGKIWAYVYEGQTYLKNVSITNSDDYSIAEHFTCPVVEGKLLTIGVDKTNPIKFNVGENFKTVKVSLSKNITDTLGIKMNAEKSWNYQITESTDEKATVTLTSVAAEGSVYLAGTKDYSLGQKITLSFTEDADYQFIKWDYDSSIIFVAEPESANTIATVLDKTSGEDSTQIKAVCAPRLRVTEYSPVTDGATQTVCKNSSIVISFNHKLPISEEDLAQLQNISITIGGSPVKSSFKAPVINEDTITFAADNSNMLDVPAGQKKTVSVTVPADFYYTLEDGTKITYGGNGKSFDYKIDDTTLDKAEISFTAANGSGELTAASGTKKYSIGQEVPLVFVPADGWTFNGWSVMCGGQPVDESKIKIADVNALSTKLTVYEALTGVTVRAKTSRCLEISETSPAAQTNPKDSSIIIKFNQDLAAECASTSMLNKIEISSDVKLDSYYTKRTLSGDTITIENTSPLSVPKGTTKVITVTVPSDFYYEDEGNKINLTEKTFSFKVDYTTNAKAKVTYQVINGETDSAFSPADVAGTIEGLESAYQEYNIGEDAELSFALNTGYQFYGWKLTDADSANGLISNQVSFKDSSSKDLQPTLVFNKPINNLVVNVICYKRPVVISNSPSSTNSSDTFAKNETIEIGFDHKIDAGTENEIVVGYSISSFSKSTYYETSLNSTQDKITLKPIKMLPVEKAYETVTVTVPCEKVYYLAKDGKTKITPADNDYTWSFRVNNSTIDKTVVRMDSTDASGSVIKVNGDDFSTGDKQAVYMEQSINLEYPVPAGYAFSGWKIVAESDDYTITPAGYVTSGEITVKKDDVEYCKLIINSEASRKAVFSSTDAIGSGAGGHAITVSVRDVLLPKIEIFNPAASVNPKDSEITISFNKELAENCSSLLDKIKITMDGNNVDSFFEDRSLSGNTISIKNTGLLDVTGTAKKTITVTVPAIFYYMDGNSQVYLAEEKSFEYKVDSSTKAKIGIRFDSHENSTKKINVNGAETNNGTKGTYNLGETVNLEYALPGDYKFVGWKIVAVSSDYTVTPSNYVTSGTIALKKDDVTYFTLKIDESNPTKAVVQAFGEVENNSNDYGLSVLTKDVVLPAITETTPSASVVSPKSSTIKIKFNQALAAECSTLLDKIKITMDGNTVDDFFENRSLSGETITIRNTKLLNITGKTTKTINVTVPAIFYYLEGNLKVTLPEEKTFSYKVDANTVEKANIHFDSAASSLKKINVNETEKQHNSDGEFNIGEIVNLEYALPDDYKFAGWKVAAEESYTVTPANYVTSGTITVEKDDKTYFTLTIDEKNSAKAVIQTLEKMEEPDDGYALTVYAKDVELPAITATTPSVATNPKDSVITITFNKALDAEFSNSDILKKIKITMDGSNVDSFFETRTLSTDRKTISIKNTKLLNVTGNENKNIEVTIPANVFYYKDGDLKVYLTEEKTVSYKVDSSTTNKTTIRFDSSENSIQKLKVNETDVTHGTSKAYNRGETIKLEYSVPATYKFAGWKLTPATNAYTATPSGYVTSGTITVSKNQIPYLTLKVDADNPAKAVVESYEAVENGTGDYGVSVFAKDTALPVIQSVKIDDLTDIYNAQNTGISCDSKVYFNFNNPIDGETFTLARNGSITITDIDNPGLHFENYFTLYCYNYSRWKIIPKPELADEFFKNEADTLYLLITLNANRNEIKDTNGYKLIVNQTINNSFEIPYTVTGKRETKKPAWYGDTQKVAKTSASYDSGINTNVFSNNWNTTTRRKNHVAGSVWINMKGEDTESGVKALRVTETYYKDVQANDVNITQEPEDLLPTSVYSNYTYFNKEYKFKTHNDGILKLDFQLVDYAGNLSEPKTFYVIKDTSLDPSIIRLKDFKKETSYDGVSKCVTKRTDSNNQETITLTADNDSNTIKDIFYSIYNSTSNTTATWCDYQEDFTTEVWWGYSEDAITNKITQGGKATNKTYTFTHDTTRLTYVKIKCTDFVGNAQEIIRIIPPKPVIDLNCYTATANTASGANNGRFLKITPCNFASLQALKNKYNMDVLVYAELRNVTTNTTQIIKIPDNGWLLQAGKTYEIRPIYVFDFQDCWSSVACDKYFKITVESNVTFSSSCTASLNPGNSTFTIPAADKPDSIYLTITDSINSGCKKVTVTNSYSSNYSWVYMFKNRTSNKIELFTTKQFELPTPADYDVILRAINSSGSICDIGISKVFANSNGYISYFSLSGDATPPVLNLPKEYTHEYYYPGRSTFSGLDWIEPSGYVIREMPTDAKSGIYEVEDSVGELSYYFIPSSGNRMTANERYTFDQLSEYTEHKLQYSSEKQTIVIPYLDLPEDCYKICIVVKDNNENRAIQAGIACNKIMAKSGVEYTIETNSSNTSNCQLVADFEDQNLFPNSNFEKTVHSYVCEYESGDWIPIKTSDGKHIDISNYHNNIHSSKSNPVSKTLLNNKWIKVVAMQSGRNSPIIVNEAGFFDVKYVYTPYYLGTPSITCRKKNVIEGGNGVQIFCDQPIFAHTMYYPKKLTEGKTEKDIAMWETKGVEISVKFESSDFTYGSENYKEIPAGYYYTTVVHFADGTTVMGDVKQK